MDYCYRVAKLSAARMSFNTIRENKTLAKISGFTVSKVELVVIIFLYGTSNIY